MSEVEWTNDLVVKLMAEYKKRPELWDSHHELYRVNTAKYEAWSDLANLFECDIIELRKKLNSIFASHRREKAKVRCGGRSTWFLYPHLSFLPTHIENDESSPASERRRRLLKIVEKTEQYSNEDNTDIEDNESETHEEIIIKTEPTPNFPKAKAKNETKQAMIRKPRIKKVIKRIIKENNSYEDKNKLMEMVRLLKRSDLLKKKDECDSFGEYVANSLRKHDERTQSMIKQAINNILFEQEMKKYSTNQYTVVMQGIDENPLILTEENVGT